ncbi:beta galactosidase jelly roll domain-containing protein [Verrucomicrobiaceae bacterium N1E253]|uniref:Beta galactosidase jelly roll domain-containing protein n=1 Tax=Oceaniferula marina TaxID=2748318 RepID=A0A851GE97_9BACT|nr:sugar-binding domain-containing protein [Oceaniferula marina]NWK55242.1 beta galactosidase jelly roll domain-containing protein [Oceaniferula marina]
MTTDNNDFFAHVASRDNQRVTQDLYEPQPPVLDRVGIPAHPSPSAAPAYETIQDEFQLKHELKLLRAKMLPFMQNHAPELPRYRKSLNLSAFDWREECEADKADFVDQVINGQGEWEKVTIPHYGPPMGKATTFYRTTVEMDAEDLAIGSTFLCFKGVDYEAHVYLNGAYVGSHEGFFAPFELDVSKWARAGENVLLVRVDNDAINMGNRSWGNPEWEGDKIYGATGPGWDDPNGGWHHCPPGMGIYQDVKVEFRPTVFIHDLYVRPLVEQSSVELWVEVYNTESTARHLDLQYSIHGKNFKQENIAEGTYAPVVRNQPGFGDMVKPNDHKLLPMMCGSGVNYFKIEVSLPDVRRWTLEQPWLYQLHLTLTDQQGETAVDSASQHFGMRTFCSDEEQEPKGRMFFNDEEIRLRGTNTMGHLQQCVIKKDWDQLIDDILLAKLCNMNFFRMTQRPVQPEIYEHFDQLGILSQSDFPMFGNLRRNQYDEALRQVREMERLLRSHPSCVIISYMNEPFPNGDSKPHRNLDFEEMRAWYDMADQVVRQANPDRVIKAVDGDYDPPSPGIADRHCYNMWYGNHGIDFGKMHRGFWQVSKKGWAHGCGEFGVEGLDSEEVMNAHYPAAWMEAVDGDGNWVPDPIPYNQTHKFHHLWYETPKGGAPAWVAKSHDFQAMALRHIGESFRRDNLCVTCAVHLFIDAFPSNWMKTIMDYHRKPKGGYFGIREAFSPLAVSLRTDRFSFYAGEACSMEAWVANDTALNGDGYRLHYQVVNVDGELLASGGQPLCLQACKANYEGDVQFEVPSEIGERAEVRVLLTLVDPDGKAVHQCSQPLVVMPKPSLETLNLYYLSGGEDLEGQRILEALGVQSTKSISEAETILVDSLEVYQAHEESLLKEAHSGKRLVLLSLPSGEHQIAGLDIEIMSAGMAERHTVSRDTGHSVVAGLAENDMRFWYDEDKGYITPFCRNVISPHAGIKPMLVSATGTSGHGGVEEWTSVLVAGEIEYGEGSIYLNQIDLGNRLKTNCAAGTFAAALLSIRQVKKSPDPQGCLV